MDRYKRISVVSVCFLSLLLIGCQESREITARQFRVLRIVDGDTFKIQYDGENTSVRLYGIDAPEMSTPKGPASKKALSDIINGKVVRLSFVAKRKRDNFGRLLARVFVGDLDVCLEMIRLEQAKPYQKKTQKRP